MILPKKKRMMLTIFIISIIAIIVIGLMLYLSLATDSLKSNDELFAKYMLNVAENVEEFSKTDTDERLENNKFESNMQVELNYIKNVDTTDQDKSNSLNDAVLKVDSQIDNKNKYNYKLISLYKDTQQIGKMEYIRDDDIYGIHIPGIKQFIAVKNENLKDIFDTENLPEEQAKLIKDKIPEIKFDISEFEFTKEEKEQLINTYKKIIDENTSKENYSKQNNALITFDKKDVNVNSYSLTLTKENYNDLKIKILEQLKKDEIILSKIDKIQNKINDIYSVEDKDYKQDYINNIEERIKEIKDTNIGQEEVKVTVYAKNKRTIRLSIDEKTTKTIVDFIGEDPNMSIKLSISKADVVADETEITLTKQKQDNQKDFSAYIHKIKDEKNDEIELKISNAEQNDTINNKYSITYNNGKSKIEIDCKNDIKFVEDFSENINFEENNIILNDADETIKSRVIQAIKTKGGQQFELITSNIKLADISEILTIFNDGETISLEEYGATEKDKDRFNSQFEFFDSSDLTTENLNFIKAMRLR